MAKVLDLSRSVYELANEYPELVDIMAGLGFTEITKKLALNSVGKVMTIPKGAKIKGIPMEKVIAALTENGFSFAMDSASAYSVAKKSSSEDSRDNRNEQLKAYLKRLGEGESLDSVRADFVRDFEDVEASEIMRAEQELLKEGTPLNEVQKLCDIHSALFHGATREERIANAERAVEASIKRASDYSGKEAKAAELSAIEGHPLNTFTRENNVLADVIGEIKTALENKTDFSENFSKLREVSVHYAKKGDLIYPQLKEKYEISGPSDVMWTVDDEIRDELKKLAESSLHNEAWELRMTAVLKRAEEMIYKEKNILFPICAVNFTDEEWMQIYRDSKDYAVCLGVEKSIWPEAELNGKTVSSLEGEIRMPGGVMNVEELTAMLNTIPLEISFVDRNDVNKYFNEGPKVFKRPSIALGHSVYSCHPPKIELMVRSIINGFRGGAKDKVSVWMEKAGRTMLVTYMAVRDKNKNYLGTLEIVQDMEEIKKHFAN